MMKKIIIFFLYLYELTFNCIMASSVVTTAYSVLPDQQVEARAHINMQSRVIRALRSRLLEDWTLFRNKFATLTDDQFTALVSAGSVDTLPELVELRRRDMELFDDINDLHGVVSNFFGINVHRASVQTTLHEFINTTVAIPGYSARRPIILPR
jgi:hypothetical protein